MNRLEIVSKYAVRIDLNVDLMATAKAKELLGKTRHVSTQIPALQWNNVSAFYASLAEPSLLYLARPPFILADAWSAPLRFNEIQDNI
ncbi:MAG: hypothetical protein P8M25_13995 [Paracoccaceae bacterium]|jgi:hypothetical protein|nr:hypothetical protein [Paracoccaceae bacterium]